MTDYWGTSILEAPRLVYVRRGDRFLAAVWPPKRRRLRIMQALAAKPLVDIQREMNAALRQLLVYGYPDAD